MASTSDEEAQAEHAALLSRFHALQAEWRSAAARKAALSAPRPGDGGAAEPVLLRLRELRAARASLGCHAAFLRAQLAAAGQCWRGPAPPDSDEERERERAALEAELAAVMRAVDEVDEELPTDAALVRAALAEQRMEIRVLRAALERTSTEESEALVPVPPGRLRLLTGPHGHGLQRLRARHRVTASALVDGDAVEVRVRGHSGGVENCVHEIRSTLGI